MPTFFGHAFIYGVSKTGDTIAVGAYYASAFLDSAPINYRAKMDEHVGTSGLTAAFVFTNPYLEMTLSLRPASKTVIPYTQAKFIRKGMKASLSGFHIVKIDGDATADYMTGDWLVLSDSTLTLNRDDAATIEITVRRYCDATQQTTLGMEVTAAGLVE